MVYHHASTELEDARDRVGSENYNAAGTFVSNAKADIEDAPFDFGIWKDEFDKYHDEFQKEVEKQNPEDSHLEYVLDEIDKAVDEMKRIRAEEDDHYDLE
ncbi:hypothetical protein OB920_13275 [Halobacteria archaeon HArc-gm2]|nr:hypothetical protein [Halobacteria archaeon HArc-gm2]